LNLRRLDEFKASGCNDCGDGQIIGHIRFGRDALVFRQCLLGRDVVLESFTKFVRMLRGHLDGILSWTRQLVSTAPWRE
jgi:hypothetical protein